MIIGIGKLINIEINKVKCYPCGSSQFISYDTLYLRCADIPHLPLHFVFVPYIIQI